MYSDFRNKQWYSSALKGIRELSSVEISLEESENKDVGLGTKRQIQTSKYECFCTYCRNKYAFTDSNIRLNLTICPNHEITEAKLC